MKRKALKKLKEAESVGWLAEFPQDIYGILINSLRPDERGLPELGVMMSLMGTCKMIAGLLKEPIVAFLCDLMSFDGISKSNKINSSGKGCLFEIIRNMPDNKECMFAIINDTLHKARNNLRTYLLRVISDPSYHTTEHLSNSLSLIHLAYLEGRYLCKRHVNRQNRTDVTYTYEYIPITTAYDMKNTQRLGPVRYFNTETRKAQCLYRMSEVVAKQDNTSLQDLAIAMLKKGDAADILRTVQGLTFPCSRGTTAFLVEIMLDAGESMKAGRAHANNTLEDVIVTIDNKQCSIFSEAATLFRSKCFIAPTSRIEDATYAYLLSCLHTRNWAIVTDTGRYRLT